MKSKIIKVDVTRNRRICAVGCARLRHHRPSDHAARSTDTAYQSIARNIDKGKRDNGGRKTEKENNKKEYGSVERMEWRIQECMFCLN